jgi:biopolymer transport protein ExbD
MTPPPHTHMRNTAPFVRRRMSMTPLIDVIFLLLMFFMLSSTFSSFGEIELNQATAGTAVPGTQSERVFVQLGAERLVLNGTPITLDELAARIETGQVLVSLDADTSAQRLVDLLVRLRGRDGLTVTVLE